MKTLVVALCTAGCVFALASAWSDILQPQTEALKREAASRVATAPHRSATRAARSVAEPAGDDESPQPARAKTQPRRTEAAAVRTVSAEIAPVIEPRAEVEARLLEQAEEARRHEARLVLRQESLRMIYDDIRDEQTAVEDIRRKATDELATTEQRVVTASQREATSSRRTPSAGRQRAETTSATENGLTHSPDSPSVRSAVLLVRRLVAQGSRDTAVSLLDRMKEREAAKVLSALAREDSHLASALALTLQASKQTARPD